jgi:hypothetical protein
VIGCLVVGEPRIDYEGGVIVSKTIRVIFEAKGGFVNRRASEEEHKQHEQVWHGIREKWKKDPGIQFLCRFLRPGVGFYFIFEVDNISKVEEMDRDIWRARDFLVTDYSFEIVLGDTRVFENWRS